MASKVLNRIAFAFPVFKMERLAKVSSTFSVSSENVLDCNNIVEYMSRCGIMTSISSNISIFYILK